MTHDNPCASRELRVDHFMQTDRRLGIEIRQGFVQNEDLRSAQQRPRDRDSLALTR
jgi:serine/threonine protein kinase HipA of HipAB toxin-antitoxin module